MEFSCAASLAEPPRACCRPWVAVTSFPFNGAGGRSKELGLEQGTGTFMMAAWECSPRPKALRETQPYRQNDFQTWRRDSHDPTPCSLHLVATGPECPFIYARDAATTCSIIYEAAPTYARLVERKEPRSEMTPVLDRNPTLQWTPTFSGSAVTTPSLCVLDRVCGEGTRGFE